MVRRRRLEHDRQWHVITGSSSAWCRQRWCSWCISPAADQTSGYGGSIAGNLVLHVILVMRRLSQGQHQTREQKANKALFAPYRATRA